MALAGLGARASAEGMRSRSLPHFIVASVLLDPVDRHSEGSDSGRWCGEIVQPGE